MEYRRRSRHRKRRSGVSGKVKLGKPILIIIIIILAVYLISASAVGTWLSKNVFAPVFMAFRSDNDDKPELSDSGDVTSVAFTVPVLHCWLVQFGVFSSFDNATQLQTQIQSQGAAGYIMKDGDRFRVIASAYNTESDAEDVCQSLRKSGVECSVHEVITPEFELKVTSQSGGGIADELKYALDSIVLAQGDLVSLSEAFDRSEVSGSEVKDRVYNILHNIETAFFTIADVSYNDAVMKDMQSLYNAVTAGLEKCYTGTYETRAAQGAAVKYAAVLVVDEFARFAAGLG